VSCFRPSQIQAGPITLDYTVRIARTSTIGGTPLEGGPFASVPITFHGAFDTSTANTDRANWVSYSFDSLEIDIEALGKFSAATPSDFNAMLSDPAIFAFPAIGIRDSALTGGFIFSGFTVTSPPIDPFAPTPTVYSGFFGNGFRLPWTIPLAGGGG